MKIILILLPLYVLPSLFTCMLPGPVAGQSLYSGAEGSTITISHQKTSLLVFAYPIDGVDMGSPDLLVRPFQKGSSILKVKAARPGIAPTNISVLTKEGRLYSINVTYDSLPAKLVFYYASDSLTNPKVPVLVPHGWYQLETTAKAAATKPARSFARVSNYQMRQTLRNVLFRDDLLYFVFKIDNFSVIPYDLAFVRCYERDRRTSKRSSDTEKELAPVHQYISSGKRINGQDSAILVLVFKKFAIADHKKFMIECYEKDGDRVLRLQLKGKHLLRASAW